MSLFPIHLALKNLTSNKILTLLIIIITFPIGIVVALLDIMKLYDKTINELLTLSTIAISLIVAVLAIFKLTLRYLDVKNEVNVIHSEILKNQMETTELNLDVKTKGELIQIIQEKIENQAIDEYLEKIQERIKRQGVIEYSQLQSLQTLKRIQLAINSQNAKANFNLTLGVITAIIGITLMVVFIPNYAVEVTDLSQFMIDFLPRLSVVILVETFAYFFLRMYKYNLDEIKYFQNEATSIEHKLQSLNIALQLTDQDIVKEIILDLAKTDINHDKPVIPEENMPLSLDYLVKIAEVLKNKNSS